MQPCGHQNGHIDRSVRREDLTIGEDPLEHDINWTFFVPVGRRPKTADPSGSFEIGALRGVITLTAARRSGTEPVLLSVESLEVVMLDG